MKPRMTPMLRSCLDVIAHERVLNTELRPDYRALAEPSGLSIGYLRQHVSRRMSEIREGFEFRRLRAVR